MYKKRSKKGALELSMNTIVIIVIGVTLLILGLAFVKGIFTKIGGLTEDAFEKAEGQIGVDANLDYPLNVIPTKMKIKVGETKTTTIVLANKEKADAKLTLTAGKVAGNYNNEVNCFFVDTGGATTTESVASGRFKRVMVTIASPTTAKIGDNACLFTAKGFASGEEKGTLLATVQ